MKKTLYILASLTAVLFVSCAKEVDVKEEPVEEGTLVTGTTLRAAVEGVDTKVSANAVGEYKWQASDKIAVLDDAGDVYEFTAASAGSTSEFSCASSITLGSYAAYPYSTSFAASGNAVTFEIPSTITYSADATNMPMLGKISGDNVTFKAVGGLLKLIVYGVPSGSTRLEFAAKAQKINGSFAIADASIDTPVIATTTKGANDNTITIDYSGNYNANMVFYIPLPTGTIEGFDLTFNDAGNTTKSVSVNLTVARNTIILAPTLNMVTPTALYSETFGTANSTDSFSLSSYEKDGTTAYGSASITYTVSGTATIYTTRTASNLYVANEPKSNELLIGKSGNYITIGGIPTGGASNAIITFDSNKNTPNSYTVSAVTDGVTVQTLTTDQITGSSNLFQVTLGISGLAGRNTFDIKITNSSGSNARIDNISVSTAAPIPAITFTGTGTRTIAAANLTASSTVNDVTLSGAVDGTGIGVASNESWLYGTLSGTTLTIKASEYNHTKADREGKIYLKATGATTREITVTQKPTIVPAPALTATPGDKSFTVSWAPDEKAGTYVAYYSTSSGLSDPTTGTALTIDTSTSPYTASPSVDLTNDTPYYIYVRVNTVGAGYTDVYGAPSDNWATTSVIPGSVVTEKYTVISAKASLATGTYLMGSNNNNTFAGSTTIYLWAGTVSSNKLSKTAADKTWDSTKKDFNNITGAATVTLESAGSENVWRIKVGTKYLAASGTNFSLSDDPFDWTFDNLTGTKEGMFFYNTTTTTYVSSNATGDVARAYNADTKVYKGIYFFKEN